jgi:hypothetical protein
VCWGQVCSTVLSVHLRFLHSELFRRGHVHYGKFNMIRPIRHERGWLLTLRNLDCLSIGPYMNAVHIGLMLVGVVYEDCVKIVRFVHTMLLHYIHSVVCEHES